MVFQTTAKSLMVRNASVKAPYLSKVSWKANQLIYPDIKPFFQLDSVYPWMENLFKSSKIQNFPLAGGLQHFLKKLAVPYMKSRNSLVGFTFKTAVFKRTSAKYLPNQTKINKVDSALVQQEIDTMVMKEVIHLVPSQKGELVS